MMVQLVAQEPASEQTKLPSQDQQNIQTTAATKAAYLPPDPDPAKVDPHHFTIGYEDTHIRVLRMVLPPGESTPLFEQLEHVVAVVRATRLVMVNENSAPREMTLSTGQAIHGPRERLAIRNIGNVTFEAVITELKDGLARAKRPIEIPPERKEVIRDEAHKPAGTEESQPTVPTPAPAQTPSKENKSAAKPLTAEDALATVPKANVKTAEIQSAETRITPPKTAEHVLNPKAPSSETSGNKTQTAAAVLEKPTILSAAIPGAKASRINNTLLTYYEQGSGVPVVFVHGLLEDLRSWSRQVDDFSAQFHAVTYSRRYHYPNPATLNEENYSYQQNADDLVAFLKDMNLGPVHLVAHSYGANVALLVVQQHLELVRSVVLMEPTLEDLLPPVRAEASKYSRLEILGIVKRAFGKQRVPEHGLQVYYDWNRGSGAWDSLTLEQQQRLRDNQSALAAMSRATEFPRFTCDDAAKIKVPVLAVSGERSSPNLKLEMDQLDACVTGAVKVIVPGAGHAMHADNPVFFDQKVMEFIAKH